MTQANNQLRVVNPTPRPGAPKGHNTRHHAVASVRTWRPPEPEGRCDAGWTQRLTLMLNGITADDYLAWVRDPEPPALGVSLRSVAVSAAPIGNRIEVKLCWDDTPPPSRSAAIAAGFPLTPEVTLDAAPAATPGAKKAGRPRAHNTRTTRPATSQPQFNAETLGPCA